ncbi:MAG TPA: hypothetical protein PKY82_30935 [Pyrinomonadaceae bacterium]|nr:hypothetical protein [Pyrinomonadaceae bacterium]
MSWQEIIEEAKKIDDDFNAKKSLSTSERILISCALFAENRHNIIQSLPKNLSEQEFKKQLYFRTYGEHLPEDFFKNVPNKF